MYNLYGRSGSGSRNTGPEMIVRRLLHGQGYRYSLHRKDLPGRPDIAFPSRWKVIFVHGCFWHGHNCSKGKLPKSRTEYWTAKIKAPLMLQYAGLDARIAAGWPAFEEALKANHVKYEAFIYDGANHGFHNDTTPRYDEKNAKLAWKRTLEFFAVNLKAEAKKEE